MDACQRAEEPFFTYVSLPKPHQCYTPSEPFWSMYDSIELPLPPNAEYDMTGKAPNMQESAARWAKGEWALFEPKTFEAARQRKLQGYLGNISHVDHAVGQLLEWLDESGLAEQTIVVYSSDHGDYACEHGIMEKAPGICSDAITRVPYIWRWPGQIQAGYTAKEVVETIDFTQTLCRLIGIDPMDTSDGQDITPMLQGKSGSESRIGVTENVWGKSVRKGKYRYVYYPRKAFVAEYPDGFGELYDLEADPWEMRNLYFKPEYADVVAEMNGELIDFLVTTTRPRTVLRATDHENERQSRTRYHNRINTDGKIHPRRIRIQSNNYL
jgi:choline-sulfatase/uncharacterized sulfatase